MHGVIERSHLDVARHDPAQRDGESRLPRPPVAGVREDHGVGAQLAPVLVEELAKVWRAPLLLAFDEHGHTHRWTRVVRAQRAGMNDHTALVVGRSAAIEPTVLLDGLEWIRVPEMPATRGLDVVMRVKQDGRRAGGGRDVSDDRWNALDLDDLGVASCIAEDLRRRLGRASELRRIVTGMADRRNADEGLEVGADPGHVVVDAVTQRCGGRLRLHGEMQPTPEARRPRKVQRQRIDFVASELWYRRDIDRNVPPKLNASP